MRSKNEDTTEYKSYMLRLWRLNRAEPSDWRASLESPLTGERTGFASLRALVAHLEALTGARILPRAQQPGIEPEEGD